MLIRTRVRTCVIAVLSGLLQPMLFAQSPTVTSVVSIGNIASGRLSPGQVVRVTGTNFNGTVAIQAGGRPATLFPNDASATFRLAQLPVELPPGPTTLVVTTSSGSSAPFNISLDLYAPYLGGFTFECPYDSPGGAVFTVLAGGLGATDPPVSTGHVGPSAEPLARTVVKPTLTIAGQAAEILDSALVNWFPSVYQINFRAPRGLPDGAYPAILSIGGTDSEPTQFTITANFINTPAAGSSSSFQLRQGAPESLMKATRCGGLATAVVTGDARNPPVTLAGTTVKVKDAASIERPAQILYVSPTQVNYIIPSGTSPGDATVTITSGNGNVSTGPVDIQPVMPNLFQSPENAFPDDSPLPVALLVRLRDGVQTVERLQLLICDPMCRSGIDMGPDSDQLFLVLFGTALRFRSSLSNVSVTIGGVDAPVEYAGPQGEFAGLDQINVRLPRSLAGRGGAALDLLVDGKAANQTFIRIN
jgi:uncharacterized protein (TIGR03437 family)